MTEWIKTIIESSSYPGVVLLMVLENVFPPIPSELIIPLAGFVSTQGALSIWGVILAGTAGSVIGAVLLYGLGHRLGGEGLRRWCDAHGRWIGLTRGDLDRSDGWFERHGAWTVLLGRVVPGVRSLISIPAGSARMSFGIFLLYTVIGSAVWTTALAFAGRWLGRNYEQVERVVGPLSTTIIVGLIALWLWRALRTPRRAES